MIKNWFKNFLSSFLSDYGWYRRKTGGTWYRVYDPEAAGFGGGNIGYWTRQPEEGDIIEITESY